jgi:hypothetical protein
LSKISDAKLPDVLSELISEYIRAQDLEISPAAEVYVVDVVGDLSAVSHQLVARGTVIMDLFRQGLDSVGGMRTEYLRTAGDVSLFMSGIFPDSLESRRIFFTFRDVITIGQQAYGSIRSDFFDELSHKFPGIVEVLNSVSREIDLMSGDLEHYIKRRRTLNALARR